MFGQPKQFFALAELPVDVLGIDGEIDEIKLGVRNLAIIWRDPPCLGRGPVFFFGRCSVIPGGDVYLVEVASSGGP